MPTVPPSVPSPPMKGWGAVGHIVTASPSPDALPSSFVSTSILPGVVLLGTVITISSSSVHPALLVMITVTVDVVEIPVVVKIRFGPS